MRAGRLYLRSVRFYGYSFRGTAKLKVYGDEIYVTDGDGNIFGNKLLEAFGIGREVVVPYRQFGNVERTIFVRGCGPGRRPFRSASRVITVPGTTAPL